MRGLYSVILITVPIPPNYIFCVLIFSNVTHNFIDGVLRCVIFDLVACDLCRLVAHETLYIPVAHGTFFVWIARAAWLFLVAFVVRCSINALSASPLVRGR